MENPRVLEVLRGVVIGVHTVPVSMEEIVFLQNNNLLIAMEAKDYAEGRKKEQELSDLKKQLEAEVERLSVVKEKAKKLDKKLYSWWHWILTSADIFGDEQANQKVFNKTISELEHAVSQLELSIQRLAAFLNELDNFVETSVGVFVRLTQDGEKMISNFAHTDRTQTSFYSSSPDLPTAVGIAYLLSSNDQPGAIDERYENPAIGTQEEAIGKFEGFGGGASGGAGTDRGWETSKDNFEKSEEKTEESEENTEDPVENTEEPDNFENSDSGGTCGGSDD